MFNDFYCAIVSAAKTTRGKKIWKVIRLFLYLFGTAPAIYFFGALYFIFKDGVSVSSCIEFFPVIFILGLPVFLLRSLFGVS